MQGSNTFKNQCFVAHFPCKILYSCMQLFHRYWSFSLIWYCHLKDINEQWGWWTPVTYIALYISNACTLSIIKGSLLRATFVYLSIWNACQTVEWFFCYFLFYFSKPETWKWIDFQRVFSPIKGALLYCQSKSSDYLLNP